jgi:DNA invertase Pin-like site-specific DNA recombinase
MGTTAIYIRVSSKTQSGWSQEGDLKKWARGQDGEIEWYNDQTTGTTMERPAFVRMMDGIHQGRITQVVVWRLDRLGRTAMGLTVLFGDLIARKVNLVSIKDGLDLATPSGRLMAHVLASVAVYETEVRRERQTAGIVSAQERGVKFGRPLTGKGNGKRHTVTPEQEQTVKRLHQDGHPKTAIAKATGLSRPTVYSILG